MEIHVDAHVYDTAQDNLTAAVNGTPFETGSIEDVACEAGTLCMYRTWLDDIYTVLKNYNTLIFQDSQSLQTAKGAYVQWDQITKPPFYVQE